MSAVHAPSNHIRGAVGNVMRPALEYLIAFVPSQQGLIYGYQNSAVTNLRRNHRIFVGRARDAVRSRHCEAHALVVCDETISQRQIDITLGAAPVAVRLGARPLFSSTESRTPPHAG
jgi:hypothetical protein